MHTKIFSPEILKKNEIDLLIVMVPGIYPDEVIKTAKNMNLKADIAKLRDNKIKCILSLCSLEEAKPPENMEGLFFH